MLHGNSIHETPASATLWFTRFRPRRSFMLSLRSPDSRTRIDAPSKELNAEVGAERDAVTGVTRKARIRRRLETAVCRDPSLRDSVPSGRSPGMRSRLFHAVIIGGLTFGAAAVACGGSESTGVSPGSEVGGTQPGAEEDPNGSSSGTSGASGTSGSNGSSGTSGTSGASGGVDAGKPGKDAGVIDAAKPDAKPEAGPKDAAEDGWHPTK